MIGAARRNLYWLGFEVSRSGGTPLPETGGWEWIAYNEGLERPPFTARCQRF